jgi:hypothetical protein
MLTSQSVVVAAKDQVSCDLAGEVAILGLTSGTYYGLDAVGARIWNLLQQPISIARIEAVLVKEYDVEPARCERDLLALIEELAAARLIDVSYGRNEPAP